MLKVALHCMGQPLSQAAGELEAQLRSAGVQCTPYDPLRSIGIASIVLFVAYSEDLLRLVREMSAAAIQRVLLLSMRPDSLAGGAAWELLRAGGSDVLTWSGDGRTAKEVVARLERWQQVDTLVTQGAFKGR